MTRTQGTEKASSHFWIWWVVLAVTFALGMALVLAKPWEAERVASPSPTASDALSPSASPSAIALSADNAVLSNPAGLAWNGEYTARDSGETEGEFPPFKPDGDYPGSSEMDHGEDGLTWIVRDAAPPWFEDMNAFTFVSGSARDIGNGVAMDAYLVDGGFLQAKAADGTPTAWMVAAFNTDQHSTAPRWAICRFHLTGEDSAAAVDAVYCDQAEESPVGDTWSFYAYTWWLDGDTLYEERLPAWVEIEEENRPAPSTFAPGDGPGGVVLDGEFGAAEGGSIATWSPGDIGLTVPSEREVHEANGCEYNDAGELEFCPDI